VIRVGNWWIASSSSFGGGDVGFPTTLDRVSDCSPMNEVDVVSRRLQK
jgi:hypothetical protein